MAEVEVEVGLMDYLRAIVGTRISTEFVDSNGRRRASAGRRLGGRPYDVVARICYDGERRCFVSGKTEAGRLAVAAFYSAT